MHRKRINIAVNEAKDIEESKVKERLIALAGNPNVGKSTVFNKLTGMHQHTGNWTGKTVANALGRCRFNGKEYLIADIPGCYSLSPHSAEEEIARDFICSGEADAIIVVCAATSIERNLNLVLQILQTTEKVVVCVNLLDEAAKKGIKIDLHKLSLILKVPVVGTTARSGKGLDELLHAVEEKIERIDSEKPYLPEYPTYIEAALTWIEAEMASCSVSSRMRRYIALRLLTGEITPEDIPEIDVSVIKRRLHEVRERIADSGISEEKVTDDVVSATVKAARRICEAAVDGREKGYSEADRKLDGVLTGKWTALPIMLALLTVVFWITLQGANYPSAVLREMFIFLENKLIVALKAVCCPDILCDMLACGVFRILGWVVSVMLPPMAIFFPMFTILEDLGYLPRIAFNMDHTFKKCGACGKQALTTCMGFGCNAAGVTGCRIIDSPRERLIAILTNCFVPCNGRFPTIASIITMFLAVAWGGIMNSLWSALLLAGTIVFGVLITLVVSKILSCTLLKGVPSAYTLELPPYRKPQWGQVIIRSVFDRTLFVLGRAVVTAAPAGLLIWIMANVSTDKGTLLSICSSALDAPAKLMGLDGTILMSFILGFPANEIVVPIMIMAYTAQGNLSDIGDLSLLYTMLVENGWTWQTGISVIVFSLMHWPCSTTCLTIYKETKSVKWTALAIAIPTFCGIVTCMILNLVFCLFA